MNIDTKIQIGWIALELLKLHEARNGSGPMLSIGDHPDCSPPINELYDDFFNHVLEKINEEI